ncbi:MAG: LysR substrate-binding domain-containing protein [Paraburkholderia sp.]|uniref:LysR substrate-binding domain-containing protein n=1 Tax=Paraburkholderia sp. TaxID=1926495 RepID=UPI00397C52F5
MSERTLLHCEARPTAWTDWLSEFWPNQLVPAQSLRLEHLYFALQTALDGLGVAMGPSSLIPADVAAGRLVIPFGKLIKRCENYYVILRQDRQHDPVTKTFCDWLEEQGTQFANAIMLVLENGMVGASEP